MMKYSTDHGRAIGRWFAHPLGVCKSAHPLNGLSRLETWHSEPNLGLNTLSLVRGISKMRQMLSGSS